MPTFGQSQSTGASNYGMYGPGRGRSNTMPVVPQASVVQSVRRDGSVFVKAASNFRPMNTTLAATQSQYAQTQYAPRSSVTLNGNRSQTQYANPSSPVRAGNRASRVVARDNEESEDGADKVECCCYSCLMACICAVLCFCTGDDL